MNRNQGSKRKLTVKRAPVGRIKETNAKPVINNAFDAYDILKESEYSASKPPRNNKKGGLSPILFFSVAGVLLAVIIALSVVFYNAHKEKSDALAVANEMISQLESYKAQAIDELARLEAERAQFEHDVEELSMNTDDRIKLLNEQIAEKNAAISALDETITRYKDIYAVDVRDQVDMVNELTELIENGAPLHNLKEGMETSELKVGDIDEEGNEITEKYFYEYPKISVYYEDLSTGFRYTYNASDVMYSASVVKVMYMVSLLEDVSKAYAAAEEARENPDDPLKFENEIYDIENNKWILTESAKKTGSGKLKDMAEGTEFTYLELVQYAITESDNTAFYELRRVFEYDSFYALASKLGVKSVSRSFNNLSAEDAGKFLRHIYEFIESGDRFGEILKEYMMSTKFNILIPSAVYPTKVAHKYGWDEEAYHDAGIVYNEKPYILVIMTDMDEAGDDVNDYIKEIAKQINKLHKNFYG